MVHFRLSGLKFLEGVLPLDPTLGQTAKDWSSRGDCSRFVLPRGQGWPLVLMAAFTWTYLEQIGELCLQNQKLAIEMEDEVSRNWS